MVRIPAQASMKSSSIVVLARPSSRITHILIDPQINDNGEVVWWGYDGDDHEIFLYSGASTTQLTNNTSNDMQPQINDSGWVGRFEDDGQDFEIILYDGTTTIQLTNNSYWDRFPQMRNNIGQVVWEGDKRDIFLDDGFSITRFSNHSFRIYDSPYPQINNNGEIIWRGWDGSNYEVFIASPSDCVVDDDGDGFCSSVTPPCHCLVLDCDDSDPT